MDKKPINKWAITSIIISAISFFIFGWAGSVRIRLWNSCFKRN